MPEPPRAVFLSYASQDAEAARRICEALRAAGIEIWFDQSELRGGDAWDRLIRKQIHDCALFMPIISDNSQARAEGYFRREWKLAVDRTHDMSERVAFLVPIVIDDTREAEADVPEKFMDVQWTHLRAGETPPAFVERVSRLLSPDAPHATVASPGLPDGTERLSAPGQNRSAHTTRRFWRLNSALLVIVTAAVATAGYFAIQKLVLPKGVAATVAMSTTIAPPAASTVPEKSIAVLPFVNMSSDKEQEYFSDGLTEDLLDLLAQVPDLRVPARTSSFYFKGKSEDIATIAEKLRVTHILEGSVRRSGNTIRVTAQLVRADTGYHLWSKTYDRDAKDVFKIQDEIARSVVQSLKAMLLASTPRGDRATANFEAYTLLLQGRFLNSRGTPADAAQATMLLERAVTLDPTYAPAWAELSQSYWFLSFIHLGGAAGDAGQRSKEAAERAVALDSTLAAAHEALAVVKMYLSDWAGAAAEYDAARKAEPRAPPPNWVPLHLGCVAGPCHDELIRDLSRQADLDPLNANIFFYRANAHYFSGELEGAERDYHRALELSPSLVGAHFSLVSVLLRRHDFPGALVAAESAPVESERRLGLAAAYWGLGRSADAERALQDVLAHDSQFCAYCISTLYAMRGDFSVALEWLERAYQQHEFFLAWMKIDPGLTNLRDDPRFKALLRRMNLLE